MSKKTPKKLVVEFDVTALSKAQTSALAGAAIAQGEASDGQGGKRYYKGETEGLDAPFLDSKVGKRGKRKILAISFDVTGFTKSEIGYLASEVEVQAEGDDDAGLIIKGVPQNVVYPSTSVTSKVVEGAR